MTGDAAGPLAAADPGPAGLHATTVAFGATRGVLILGASGSGKSALALHLMALGASLVADDRTLIARDGDALVARCPEPLQGLIEARGIGLIRVHPLAQARLVLAIDLDRTSETRLPPFQSRSWLGIALPMLHKVEGSHFPAAIMHYIGAMNLDQP